jgi:hypothetical protein
MMVQTSTLEVDGDYLILAIIGIREKQYLWIGAGSSTEEQDYEMIFFRTA